MALLSPGSEIKEIDASLVTPRVGSSAAVFCGDFTQGPVDELTMIGTQQDYVAVFGKPNPIIMNQWYQPYNFLEYKSGFAYVTRVIGADARNAAGEVEIVGGTTPNSVSELVKNKSHWDSMAEMAVSFGVVEGDITSFDFTTIDANLTLTVDTTTTTTLTNLNGVSNVVIPADTYKIVIAGTPYNWTVVTPIDITFEDISGDNIYTLTGLEMFNDDSNSKLKFIARNPGVWGDNISVAIANSTDFGTQKEAFAGVVIDDQFEYAPEANEIAVLIAMNGILVETYVCSLEQDAVDFANKNIYIENVINENSSVVFVKDNTAADTTVTSKLWDGTAESIISLVGGVDGVAAQAQIIDGYKLYENKDDIDVDIIIANEIDPVAAMNLTEARKDCVAYIGATFETTVGKSNIDATAAITNWARAQNNSFFATFWGNYKFQFDKFTGKNVWVNIAGDMAGVRAQTNEQQALWYASAGTTRGAIKNVKQFAFTPNKAQQDALYQNKTNIVTSMAGSGNVVWGNKTFTSKPSAFDRINVRNLFNHVERVIYKLSRDFTFEFNDAFTRNRFLAAVGPFLASIQSGRGIMEFRAVCDETNNTPAVVEKNEFVADIVIKPMYVAEFFTLKFTAVNASANIDTIVG